MRVQSIELFHVKSYEKTTIELAKGINLLIGANNSGKSTIIQSLMNLQYSAFSRKDIRLPELFARVHTKIVDINERDNRSFYSEKYHKEFEVGTSFDILWQLGVTPANTVSEENLYISPKHLVKKGSSIQLKSTQKGREMSYKTFPRFPDSENSNNFIFPFLAKRKTEYFDQNINQETSFKVLEGMRNLASRIQRMGSSSHPRHDEYVSLCEDILGFRVGVIPIDSRTMHRNAEYNRETAKIKYLLNA